MTDRADFAAWVPAPGPLPAGDTYRITNADLEAYLQAVQSWGGSLVIGEFKLTGELHVDPLLHPGPSHCQWHLDCHL